MASVEKKDFQRKKMEALTLGACLKKLRTEAGIDVGSFAVKTKIQAKYIEALEAGEYAHLPSKVYVKGFVEAYGRELHIPVGRLKKLLHREYDVYENIAKKHRVESPIVRSDSKRSFHAQPRVIAALLSLVLILGGGYYLFTQVRAFVASPWLVVTSPENSAEVREKEVEFRGETAPNAILTINEQVITVNDSGEFLQKINLVQGENVFVVRSTNQFGQATAEQVTVHGVFEVLEPVEPIAEATSIAMEIRAGSVDVWLSIVRDELTAETLTLLAGETHHVEALEQVLVTSGRGDETFIVFNGKELGALGPDENVVRDVPFDLTGRVDSTEDATDEQEAAEEKEDIEAAEPLTQEATTQETTPAVVGEETEQDEIDNE